MYLLRMRTTCLLIGLFVASCSMSIAQCDSELAAAPGTYLVEMNLEKVDATTAPIQLADCAQLEEIESNRRDEEDTTIELGNYIVTVYSRSRVINIQNSGE